MGSITISWDPTYDADVVGAFSQDYQPEISPGVPNPETRAQYATRRFKEMNRQVVVDYRAAKAAKTANDTSRTADGALVFT